jgi:apolipoprotein N-acyltransferase
MLGPALLTLAVWGKKPLATVILALTAGVVFLVLLLTWLVNVAWYAWAALAGAEAALFAVAAIALVPLLRLRAWPLAVAGWWVAQEALRDRWPYGGVPWGRLAMSQAEAPTAGWAAIGGPPLLTFVVALAGACLAYLVITLLGWTRPGSAGREPSGRLARFGGPRALAAAVAVAAVAVAIAGDLAWRWTPGPGPTAVVAAVQGNVPHARNLPKQLRATTVTANHADATIAFADQVQKGRLPAPNLVIWPENSTDIDPSQSLSTYQTIATAVNAVNAPVLVGAVLQGPQRNAGQLWLPGRGPVQVYIKRQLVPFGEFIPFRSLLDKFTSLPNLQPVNFTPGHRAVAFNVGRIRLGDVICWEVGFDNLVRSEVRAGANLLTVQTNDADFELDGQMGETLQQLAMARIDAISTGREVVVVSTTGISAFVAPDGTVTAATRTWHRAVIEQRVPLVSALTPADRIGAWPELAIVGLTILALAWGLAAGPLRRARERRAKTT